MIRIPYQAIICGLFFVAELRLNVLAEVLSKNNFLHPLVTKTKEDTKCGQTGMIGAIGINP